MVQVLAILAAAGSFIDNNLVRRLLINLAKFWTTPEIRGTQIDDAVIRIIYGAAALPPEERKAVVAVELAKVQESYDIAKLAAEENGDTRGIDRLTEVKPLTMPWMEESDPSQP